MLNWFRRKPPGVREDEPLEALFSEFCRTFQHNLGVNFMESLEEDARTAMIEWLQPETPCAIPKGFVRLAVDMTRKGHNIWEKEGISMAYEGNWSGGGGLPPLDSQEALSILAQILEQPIKLYYTEYEGGPHMLKEFVT